MAGERIQVCDSCGRSLPSPAPDGALCDACEANEHRAAGLATEPVDELLQRGARGTALLMLVIAGVFVAGRLWFYDMERWAEFTHWLKLAGVGDEYAILTPADEPWRLFTAAFLHRGFLHLIFCAWWIWELGRGLEMRRGLFFLVAFVTGSAIASSAAGWLMYMPDLVYYDGVVSGGLLVAEAGERTLMAPAYGIGLSGVVFAMAAFLFVTRRRDLVANLVLGPRTLRLLIAWLALGIVLSHFDQFPISNWSHAMGALWGAGIGLAVKSEYRREWLAIVALVTLALVLTVLSGVTFWTADGASTARDGGGATPVHSPVPPP